MELSDNELNAKLQQLKEILSDFPEGMDALDVELESASKHVPAYLKIVKTHLEQLRKVLQMESHQCRTIESAGLPHPVQDLMKMFEILQEGDVELIEELAHASRNWAVDCPSDESESHHLRTASEA